MYSMSIIRKNISVITLLLPTLFLLPVFFITTLDVYAQSNVNPPGAGGCVAGELCNPLQSATITDFLLKIIDVILIFAQPLIVLFIMYAGYLYVTARGEDAQITTARSALLWAVIGGVIILGARLILAVIKGTIAAF